MKLYENRGLFLDVGFAHCGCAVFDFKKRQIVRALCITTELHKNESKAVGNARRCREVAYQLKKLATDYRVKLVCGELPHGGAKSARAMASMAMSTAIVSTFCAVMDLPFVPVTPTEVKRTVKQKGAVSKDDVQKHVEQHFKYRLPSKREIREHIADAIACIEVYQSKI